MVVSAWYSGDQVSFVSDRSGEFSFVFHFRELLLHPISGTNKFSSADGRRCGVSRVEKMCVYGLELEVLVCLLICALIHYLIALCLLCCGRVGFNISYTVFIYTLKLVIAACWWQCYAVDYSFIIF